MPVPLDSTPQNDLTAPDNGLFQALIERVPEDLRGTFSQPQLEALEKATNEVKWGNHPVDIRLSVPTLLSRYYMVFLAGKERRDKGRRFLERGRFPLGKLCNWLFLAGLVGFALYIVLFAEMVFFVTHFSEYFAP